MTSFGVTLLSGGLDSTTVTVYAQTRVQHLVAVTLHYGQSHSKEVECARQIAGLLGIRHQMVDVSFFGKVAWYSALTNPDRFPLPRDRSAEKMGFGIPITYVPLRNTFFVAIAAALLESEVLYAIEQKGLSAQEAEACIFMAPNSIDYSGYPDCRPEYYERIRQALQYGSKMWTHYEVPIRVETPIINLSKAEIVELGIRLKAPLELTWSCYQGGDLPCGSCDSCILRAKGFEDAGYSDPLLVRLGKG